MEVPDSVKLPPGEICFVMVFSCDYPAYNGLDEETFRLGVRILPPRAQVALEPRKSPVQARSNASVDAILEATVQVLLQVGKERLTTTRVAARAGVSVGTLYQYFPN